MTLPQFYRRLHYLARYTWAVFFKVDVSVRVSAGVTEDGRIWADIDGRGYVGEPPLSEPRMIYFSGRPDPGAWLDVEYFPVSSP